MTKKSITPQFLISSCLVAGLFVSGLFNLPAARAQTSNDDYFVAAFGDPMDFANEEDLVTRIDSEAMFVGGKNKSISDGQLHFDASGN